MMGKLVYLVVSLYLFGFANSKYFIVVFIVFKFSFLLPLITRLYNYRYVDLKISAVTFAFLSLRRCLSWYIGKRLICKLLPSNTYINIEQVRDRAWFVRLYGEIIPEL